MKTEEQYDDQECAPVSRRAVLKVIAGAPLALAFGMLASPIARFFKPTMEPGGFFQKADMPTPVGDVRFQLADFPVEWTCIPFFCDLKYVVFNPEKEQIRRIRAFILRTAQNEIVAYSRVCPTRGCVMNFVPSYCCGCGCAARANGCGCGFFKPTGPAIICPNAHTVFDIGQRRALAGAPPRQFQLIVENESVKVAGLEVWLVSS